MHFLSVNLSYAMTGWTGQNFDVGIIYIFVETLRMTYNIVKNQIRDNEQK